MFLLPKLNTLKLSWLILLCRLLLNNQFLEQKLFYSYYTSQIQILIPYRILFSFIVQIPLQSITQDTNSNFILRDPF